MKILVLICLFDFRLQVFMFNSYKESGRTRRSSGKQGPTCHNNLNSNDFNEFIEGELHRICKLRIQICRLTKDGRLEYVSEYIDTNLIKESKFIIKCINKYND